MNFDWPTNDTTGIGSLQKLRSKGMAQTLPSQDIDDWLKESIALVQGVLRDLERIRGESDTLDLRQRMNNLRKADK